MNITDSIVNFIPLPGHRQMLAHYTDGSDFWTQDVLGYLTLAVEDPSGEEPIITVQPAVMGAGWNGSTDIGPIDEMDSAFVGIKWEGSDGWLVTALHNLDAWNAWHGRFALEMSGS